MDHTDGPLAHLSWIASLKTTVRACHGLLSSKGRSLHRNQGSSLRLSSPVSAHHIWDANRRNGPLPIVSTSNSASACSRSSRSSASPHRQFYCRYGFRKPLLDYSATKGAIHASTKSLAQNLVEKGIRVNCVAPASVWTPLNPSDQDIGKVAKVGQQVPYKRPAQPEEIAPAYVFFASDGDSSYITGEVLTLLGGETAAG
jgi:NAD(P)-dependent dehydrogenase (short-subunit alcohol dehydrogenase family)